MPGHADLAEFERHAERLRVRIGMTSGPFVRSIEAGALRKFARATGQTDPRYLGDDSGAGTIEASPTYVSTFCNEALGTGLIARDVPGDMYLHTDDTVEMGEPILAGDTITSRGRLADVHVKAGRNGPLLFQIAEVVLTNQRAAFVARVRVGTVSFDSAGQA